MTEYFIIEMSQMVIVAIGCITAGLVIGLFLGRHDRRKIANETR